VSESTSTTDDTTISGAGRLAIRDKASFSVFLREYAATGNISYAAEKAGVSVSICYRWIRLPECKSALHDARDNLLQTKGASVGLRVLLELAESPATPANVRRAAAKDLLGFGGHSEAVSAAAMAALGARKGLEDMNADELERLAAASAATLAQLRRQAAVIDVPPDITPEPPDPSSLL
jgi:hypothetical protein